MHLLFLSIFLLLFKSYFCFNVIVLMKLKIWALFRNNLIAADFQKCKVFTEIFLLGLPISVSNINFYPLWFFSWTDQYHIDSCHFLQKVSIIRSGCQNFGTLFVRQCYMPRRKTLLSFVLAFKWSVRYRKIVL